MRAREMFRKLSKLQKEWLRLKTTLKDTNEALEVLNNKFTVLYNEDPTKYRAVVDEVCNKTKL